MTTLAKIVVAAFTLSAATYASYRAQARRAAVLERIAALDACLTASNRQRAQAADDILAYLTTAAYRIPGARAVLQQAKEIQAHTEQLADMLHQLWQRWEVAGRATPGKLPEQLARYRTFMQARYLTADTLAFSLATSPSNCLEPAGRQADPLPVALASLTRLETQVRQYTATALMTEAAKVIDEAIYDKVGVFATSGSQTVGPSAEYRAWLLLSSVAANGRKQFSADGRVLSVDPRTNHGLVSFCIPTARPGQPDTVRAQWHGTIRISEYPTDTVLSVTVPYLIVKRPTL